MFLHSGSVWCWNWNDHDHFALGPAVHDQLPSYSRCVCVWLVPVHPHSCMLCLHRHLTLLGVLHNISPSRMQCPDSHCFLFPLCRGGPGRDRCCGWLIQAAVCDWQRKHAVHRRGHPWSPENGQHSSPQFGAHDKQGDHTGQVHFPKGTRCLLFVLFIGCAISIAANQSLNYVKITSIKNKQTKNKLKIQLPSRHNKLSVLGIQIYVLFRLSSFGFKDQTFKEQQRNVHYPWFICLFRGKSFQIKQIIKQ